MIRSRLTIWWLVGMLGVVVMSAAGIAIGQERTIPGSEALLGHWRSTRIVYGTPNDEHLVLRGNGVVERWSVTPSARSAPVRGRWTAQGKILTLEWEDGNQWSRPFTFHDGNLVFPNVQNQRKFWERIQ